MVDMATYLAVSRRGKDENAPQNLSPVKSSKTGSPDKARAPLSNLTANSKTPQRARAKEVHKQLAPSPLKRNAGILAEGLPGSHSKKRKTTLTSQSSTTSSLPTQGNRTRQTRDPEWTSKHGRPAVTQPNSSIYTTPRTHTSNSDDSDSGQESATSFTSLINYDPASSNALIQGPFTKSSHTSRSRISHPSNSELLRLRLRIALYKVYTNQIQTPFHRLRVYRPRPPPTNTDHQTAIPRPHLDSSASPELPTGPDLPRATTQRQSDWDATPKARIGTQPTHNGAETTYRFAPQAETPEGFMRAARGYADHGRRSSESTIVAGKSG